MHGSSQGAIETLRESGNTCALLDGLAVHASRVRVIAACDAFRAITSDRPYRRAPSPDKAMRELEAGAGSQFDPPILETVLQLA